MTEGGETTTYDYDAVGNLRTVTLPSGTTLEYVIDGRNRRVGRKVNGTLTQGYLYDGNCGSWRSWTGANNVTARYVYGTRPNVPEWLEKGGAMYRILTDHLGSPRLVVNAASGAIVQRMDYDSWGNITNDTNPGFQIFGYAGGLHDQDTKLTRFGARDYDARTGRWTAKDPIGFRGRDSNLYVYSLGDPINYSDADGMIVPLILAGAGLGAIIGGAIYYATTDNFTWGGLGGAVASGAIAGAVGTVAAPIAGAIGLGSGVGGVAVVNGLAGVASAAVSAGLDPCQDFTLGYAASSAAFGAMGGFIGGMMGPTNGMSNFKQVGFPRTWSGVIPEAFGGSAGPNAINSIYVAGGASVGIGMVGPYYVQ
ncbi:MAG: hypothetical protein IPN65_03340 [Elusimicrobia bacterium]|nr:hypothetical protein [Elusimicrobiota bacterium]